MRVNLYENIYEIKEDYAIMHITQNNQSIADVYVDIEDVEKLKKHIWRLNKGFVVYSARHSNFVITKYLLNITTNDFVDYIDNNKFNCRKSNLKVINSQQKSLKFKIRKDNSSGFKGVIFDKTRNKYRAQLFFNNRNIYLGRYNTKMEAIKARLQGEKLYYGDNAPQKHLFYLLEEMNEF